MTPSRSTSTPELASPATTAASRKSPEARESRPITATGRLDQAAAGASTGTAAMAKSIASRAVRSCPATPRTPSVPKIRPMSVGPRTSQRLALGVLRSLTGLLEAVLLPLRRPCVAGEEAGLLQRRPVLRVDERERPRQPESQRAGLARDAAAADARDHVELALGAERHERLSDDLLVHLVREVRVERPAVDRPLAGARDDADARDGLLAAARAGGVAGDHRPACHAGRGGLGGLGGVLRRNVFGVETVSGVLPFGVSRVVCGRLYASGLGTLLSSRFLAALLGNLRDLVRLRLLRLVRVGRARVHLELAQRLAAERVLRQHAADRLLDHALRVLCH